MKSKIKKNSENIQKNKDVLEKKTISSSNIKSSDSLSKLPNVLYDSGWLNIEDRNNDTSSVELEIITDEYEDTTKNGQLAPFRIDYVFKNILEIADSWLPFIRSCILIKKQPLINVEGVMSYQPYEYDLDYYEIYGDSQLIYKGQYPDLRLFPETDRITGQFDINLSSKWFYGTLEYTQSGFDLELRNGYIVYVLTTYDIVPLSGHPGYYSYKTFETLAIDAISPSSITGEGTYIVYTATAPGGTPQVDSIATKNVQKTAPMFEDFTEIHASGALYENDIFQNFHSIDNPKIVQFEGDIGSGTATLVSFDYSWTEKWRVFYSNKRAREYRFRKSDSLQNLFNVPDEAYYETATLPYAQLSVVINPVGYPEIIQEDTESILQSFHDEPVWTKITDNKYQRIIEGGIILSSSAEVEESTPILEEDETYSPSGTFYVWDGANRGDVDYPIYEPITSGVQIRLLISAMNPVSSLDFKKTRRTDNA